MKIKVADAGGQVLDMLVTQCELPAEWPDGEIVLGEDTDYSTDWSLGGPIIEREGICLLWQCSKWDAYASRGRTAAQRAAGPTPLIAAMRCYVISKLGEEVEIPEELE